METNEIREFLNILKIAVAGTANQAEIQETEEGPVLICTVSSPFLENDEMGYRISILPCDNGSVTVEIMLFVFNNIDSKLFSGLDVLINSINDRVLSGSYRLFDDNGTILFVQSLQLNSAVSEETAVKLIGKTLSLMENTVCSTGRAILVYLSGGDLGSILNQIERVEE